MCKKMLLLIAAGLMLSNLATAQENRKPGWGHETAEKLSHFLPKSVTGLVPRAPWGGQTDNKVDLSVGFEASVSDKAPEYVVARAFQRWAFDDPELFQQVAAAKEEKAKFEKERMDDFKSHIEERKTLQKQAQDLGRKGQIKELQALMEKMKALDAPNEAKSKEMEDRLRHLQGSARDLEIYIQSNSTAATTFDPSAKQGGALAGHPLYRSVFRAPVPSMTWVNLGVYVGPPGFKNPDTNGSKAILKCVLIWVRITARPETAKSDEELARKLLETIDYDGLAKLLQP